MLFSKKAQSRRPLQQACCSQPHMAPYPEATVSYGCQASLALICLLGFSDLYFQDHVKQIYTFAAHLTMSTHSLAGLCWDKPAICHLIKWHASKAAASQLVWTDLCLHIWTGQGSLAPYPGHARGFSLGVASVCNVATKLRGEKGFIAKKISWKQVLVWLFLYKHW